MQKELKNSLLSMSFNPDSYTEKKDVINGVSLIASNAAALNESLVQERFYSDEEET